MIDFKITSQANELSYGDYEKISLISEMMFKKFLRQFKTKNNINSLGKFKSSVLPRKCICHDGFGFLISSVSSSIGNILFHWNRPYLSNVMLF